MNRKVVAIGVAAVVALVGTVVLVLFVRGAEDRALEGEELVQVLTVEAKIPAGTSAEELVDFVEAERVPAKIAPEGVISDLVQVTGMVAAVDFFPGEVLLAQRFVAPENFNARRGSVAVPEGMLEVTIALSQEQFVGGVPVPGDHVAVVVNGTRSDFLPTNGDPLAVSADPASPNAGAAELRYTKIILQQALVTNVQGNPVPEASSASATERVAPAEGSVLVTLALSGPDLERLIYVRDSQSLNANLHMALHSGDALVLSEGVSVENIVDPGAPVG